MPLFDFQCVKCGRREEKFFASYAAMQASTDVTCERPAVLGTPRCTGFMQRQASAPAVVVVHGFNSQNGYASPRTIHQRRGSVKTTVSGNFEAFAGGLVNS